MSKKRKTTKKTEEEKYYKMSSFPFGGGWGGNSYYRLKKPGKKGYFDKAIKKGSVLEILWPDDSISIHEITVEIESSTSYERESKMNLTENKYYPFISLEHNGTTLDKVKLSEIKGIRMRFV